ncbi:MAG: hypothetical protein K0Q55_1146 [Verrucomicrobia bacterium]|jgi:Zn finger protein HypA/HybF involved in hydrogenase expression|nr:hypothetical protein [Verrucomicrobiota bacterium]
MSDLYRIRCESCDWSAIQMVDGKSYDYIPEGYTKLVLQDKTVVLRHLAESDDLATHGYTWEKAEAEDRLVMTTTYLCIKCSHHSEFDINLTELKRLVKDTDKVKAYRMSLVCPQCGTHGLKSLEKSQDLSFPCPKCKKPSVKCKLEITS